MLSVPAYQIILTSRSKKRNQTESWQGLRLQTHYKGYCQTAPQQSIIILTTYIQSFDQFIILSNPLEILSHAAFGILKPGKQPEELTSYRIITLLPILSKLFEKLSCWTASTSMSTSCRLYPITKLGFVASTQTHRIVKSIAKFLEEKELYTAAFLDISQAFDKVWHTGNLYKLKIFLYLIYYPVNINGVPVQVKTEIKHLEIYLIFETNETSKSRKYIGSLGAHPNYQKSTKSSFAKQ